MAIAYPLPLPGFPDNSMVQISPLNTVAIFESPHSLKCSAPGSLDTSLSHAAGLIEIAACHA